jgi:hypothetical protein
MAGNLNWARLEAVFIDGTDGGSSDVSVEVAIEGECRAESYGTRWDGALNQWCPPRTPTGAAPAFSLGSLEHRGGTQGST